MTADGWAAGGDAPAASPSQPPVRVLLLCGSLRRGSVNAAVLDAAATAAPDDVVIDRYGGTTSLPYYSPDADLEPPHPAVADLRARIDAASAVLIATPEYAGSLPGAFKNVLDWMVGGIEMTGKPVAWINASTGPTGAERTYQALRDVFGFIQPRVIDDACARIPVYRRDLDPDGRITRDDLVAAIGLSLRTLVAAARHGDVGP